VSILDGQKWVTFKRSLTIVEGSANLPHNRSDALAEAFLLTPRDTERSWSPRNPEAVCLAGDQFKKTGEKNAENETKNTPDPKLRQIA
jgi:hypothetical protein